MNVVSTPVTDEIDTLARGEERNARPHTTLIATGWLGGDTPTRFTGNHKLLTAASDADFSRCFVLRFVSVM